MKTKTIGSLFVLFAIAATMAYAPSAFAEHSMNAVVENAQGSSTPGCEETNECFIPATVTIGVGGQVTFANNDSAAHTSTAGTPADGPSGAWDSSLVMVNMSFTTPALEAGEYPYFCMVHPWMTGLVIVEEEAHDDHGHEEATEEMDHSDMSAMEMTTLTAADIAISVDDGAKAGEKVAIDVTINGEHVNYDIVATQNGETILDESDVHSHTGEGSHTTSALSADASDDNPIDVTVTFQGFGFPGDDKTGPIGLTNTAQAVPEFGTIAAMILVVAIVSIIAITSKSRLSLAPRL
jgi:predicted secreted protein with PEFG-CTERM motif|tara:strand:+ start:481 stop:1362 length:882 start_codon:yes stop_codon:yes gene_type:complete